MFLDEELEQIYQEESTPKDRAEKLWYACAKRISEQERKDSELFIKAIKRIESAWQLFAQKHEDVRNNGYRELFLNNVINDEDLRNRMKKLLGW